MMKLCREAPFPCRAEKTTYMKKERRGREASNIEEDEGKEG